MRRLTLLLLAACVAPAAQAQEQLFRRVDASFSDIAIDAQRSAVEDRLTQIERADCIQWDECDWRDSEGVRYHFWKKAATDIVLIAKMIEASDFEDREIPALGIGLARDRKEVLARMGAFIGDAEIACDQYDFGYEVCGVKVGAARISAAFTRDGQLSGLVFDGYFDRW